MKRFFRTIAGKTILFILCVLSVIIMVGAAIGIFVMIEENIYTRSEEETIESIFEQKISARALGLIYESATVVKTADGWELQQNPIVSDDGNVIFKLTNSKGKIIKSSRSAADISHWKYEYKVYIDIDPANGDIHYLDFMTDEMSDTGKYYDYTADGQKRNINPDNIYIVQLSLKEGLPSADQYRMINIALHTVFALKYAIFGILAAALLIMIASFIALMSIAGRKPNSDELYPGPLNNIPADIMLAALITAGVLILMFIFSTRFGWEIVAIAGIAGLAWVCFFIGFCMNMAVKIKQHKLIRTSLIFYILKGIWMLIKAIGRGITMIPLIWKTILLVVIISIIELIVVVNFAFHDRLILWALEKIIIVPFIFYIAISLRKLQKGGEALAEGNLEYKTDTRGLIWDFKKHGQNLNSVAEGMNTAVAERTKSERMKTELITNVSHDLKTPLTSIVNYADLISKEPCENPKITEYSEVLIKQSGKMKRLIEDLVEASKASTGNLEVNLEPCDANVFISQAVGEYEERLFEIGLTLITKQPSEPVRIMADGRRMWRIFDNLMNNIIKYALPGTRVYLTLERTEDSFAQFTFRNTSREPLDISADELMERFTRGDRSRNTEGSGLGLSIAKSMAELQCGSLMLTTDGDLFKAVLRLPAIN